MWSRLPGGSPTWGPTLPTACRFIPCPARPSASWRRLPPERVAAIRADVAQLLPIMSHCTRCRADAVGLLGEAKRPEMEIALLQAAGGPLNPAEDRPYIAVATLEGVLVNQHLGEADQLSIYAKDEAGFRVVEQRRTPPAGSGSQRWIDLADTLQDCRAVLVASAGQAPARPWSAGESSS